MTDFASHPHHKRLNFREVVDACAPGSLFRRSPVVVERSIRFSPAVDVELVFLADSSGSIDQGENAFQRRGHAEALVHPDVLSAIRQGVMGRIAVTYVEWGNAAHQDIVVPWTVIDGPASAKAFAVSYTHLTLPTNYSV